MKSILNLVNDLKGESSSFLHDVPVHVISLYKLIEWIQRDTLRYFDHWTFTDWFSFLWVGIFNVGSMYLLFARINTIKRFKDKNDKFETLI